MSKRNQLFGALALFAFAFLAYWPALAAGFVWNDSDYVTAPEIQSWHGLWRIWFDVGATQQYYPLLHSAFWIEHRLWGDAPLGYHVVNVLFHATSAGLFCLILRRLCDPAKLPPVAVLFAGLIFVLHPVFVESVAWVTEQKNTLSTVFYLLAVLVYLKFEEGRRDSAARRSAATFGSAGTYGLALFFFILAVLSKSVAATLPGALLVIVWWRYGRLSWRQDFLPLLPWFAVGAAGGLFTGWVERTYIGAKGSAFSLGVADRLAVAGRVAWFYLGKLAWPAHLIFIYPRWQVDARIWWQDLFSLAMLALLGVLWALRRRSRAPLAALLLFLGGLFPLLGLFNVYAFIFSYVADHWQYVSGFGLIALAAGGWAWLLARASSAAPRLALYGLALGVLAALGGQTWRESGNYHDQYRFYRTILARNPDCWMAHNNLGNLYYADGNMAEAKKEYQESLRLRPDYPDAHSNLGVILVNEGRVTEAIAHYQTALRLVPGYADAHNNYGIALAHLGRIDQAVEEFRLALRLKPKYVEALVNLGNNLYNGGQAAEGIACYEKALEIDPNYAEAHNNLGVALLKAGRLEASVAHLQAALRLKKVYPDAHNNLGNCFRSAGRWPEAIAEYTEAVRLKPDYVIALNNLGYAQAAVGRPEAAIADYRLVLRLDPTYADAENNLGNAYCQLGKPAEAMPHYREAVRLSPATAEYHNNLGIVLLQSNQGPPGVAEFETAVRLQPDYADAQNNLGAGLAGLGRVDEAIRHYREALRLKQNFPEAHNNIGVALATQGHLAEAAAEYREALRLKPNFANAQDNLKAVLARLQAGSKASVR